MHITDEQIAQLRADGFLIVPNFLSPTEAKAAREGFFRTYAPAYPDWIKAGKPTTRGGHVFPFEDSGLNYACAHPDLIDAAERIIGTRAIRMTEAHLGIKYHSEKHWAAFHIDYGNNTLGPEPEEGALDHLAVFYCFDEVKVGQAPIVMVPKGKPDSAAVPMIVPGGSICFYGMGTRHSASDWVGEPGHRPTAWIGFTRLDRPWDAARTFTYKSGASVTAMKKFIEEATPRQREIIGFPAVDQWSEKFLAGMVKRYPGIDPTPYRLAASKK